MDGHSAAASSAKIFKLGGNVYVENQRGQARAGFDFGGVRNLLGRAEQRQSR
jgi:hypothetical protein